VAHLENPALDSRRDDKLVYRTGSEGKAVDREEEKDFSGEIVQWTASEINRHWSCLSQTMAAIYSLRLYALVPPRHAAKRKYEPYGAEAEERAPEIHQVHIVC
jgi:hypothetical protein